MDLGRLSRIHTITIDDAIILTLGSSSDLFGANKLLWINVSGLSLTTSSLGSSSLESTSSPPSDLSSLSCSYVSPFPFEVAARALSRLWHSDRNVANLVALEAMNVLLPDRLIVPSVQFPDLGTWVGLDDCRCHLRATASLLLPFDVWDSRVNTHAVAAS